MWQTQAPEEDDSFRLMGALVCVYLENGRRRSGLVRFHYLNAAVFEELVDFLERLPETIAESFFRACAAGLDLNPSNDLVPIIATRDKAHMFKQAQFAELSRLASRTRARDWTFRDTSNNRVTRVYAAESTAVFAFTGHESPFF